MAGNSCQSLAKFSIVLNVLIYLIGGSCLILLGSLIVDNAGSLQNIFNSAYILLPAIIMLISGLFMVALAFVGCFACMKQTRCLNYTFFVVMFFIILVEIAALACTIRFKSDIEGYAEKAMQKGLEDYMNDQGVRKELDEIQKRTQCCGVLNYTDWYNTTYFEDNDDHFPASCCANANCTYVPQDLAPTNVFQKGCLVDIENFFNKYFVYLIVGYTIFILIQSTALIASCVISRRSDLENRHPYSAFRTDTHV